MWSNAISEHDTTLLSRFETWIRRDPWLEGFYIDTTNRQTSTSIEGSDTAMSTPISAQRSSGPGTIPQATLSTPVLGFSAASFARAGRQPWG